LPIFLNIRRKREGFKGEVRRFSLLFSWRNREKWGRKEEKLEEQLGVR